MKQAPWFLSSKIRRFWLTTISVLLMPWAMQVCAAQQSGQKLEVVVERTTVVVGGSPSSGGPLQVEEGHSVSAGWTRLMLSNDTDLWLDVEIKRASSPYPLLVFHEPPKELQAKYFQAKYPEINPGQQGLLSVAVLPAAVYTITIKSDRCEPINATVEGESTRNRLVRVGLKSAGDEEHGSFQMISKFASACVPKSDSVLSPIDRIANGSHQELPAPTQTSTTPGQNPGWSVENATGYQLTLYLSGPTERHYVIANGQSLNIDLPVGTYRIAADVSSNTVTPFYAVRQLNTDTRWSSHFYIERH